MEIPNPTFFFLSDEKDMKRAIKSVLRKVNRIDVLINNAALTARGMAERAADFFGQLFRKKPRTRDRPGFRRPPQARSWQGDRGNEALGRFAKESAR